MFGRSLSRAGAVFTAIAFAIFTQSQTTAFCQSSDADAEAPGSRSYENEYRIGPGDVLDIRVFNRPELSREMVRVDGRGMIRLPLINEVKAQCLTESELAELVISSYREYLRNPHVEVFIKDYQSRPVVVLGAVREPGRFQLQRRVHLLELVSLAGGPTDLSNGRLQVTNSNGVSDCTEPGMSDDTVQWYTIEGLLELNATNGSVPYARAGDTVHLLEADRAFVIGNVLRPMAISLKDPVTISQAVAMAGGTLPDSSLEKVKILRHTSEGAKTEINVDLKAIKKQQAEDVILAANDIVEVPTSTGKKFLRNLLNIVGSSAGRLPVRVIN
jgi:polysaccharide biosynthesis/export protein